jgi:NADH-quinone oxidoreductase subunit C
MSSIAPVELKPAWHGMIASDERLSALDGHVQGLLGDTVIDTTIAFGELNVTVKRDSIIDALTKLRSNAAFPFKSLMDISGADYPERPERFDVVYHLLCYSKNIRLRVRVTTDEVQAVPSAVGVFESANWNEREIWDLFGVAFTGHPDMRRLLTDYGFTGHPLRKDFPLTGYVELRYSEEDKRVIYEPVKLTQDFRSFDFLSPWEGAQYILPGDEKAGEKK